MQYSENTTFEMLEYKNKLINIIIGVGKCKGFILLKMVSKYGGKNIGGGKYVKH